MGDRTLRGAIIGCGHVAQYHLSAWAQVDAVELVALCDRDRARLEAAAVKAPGARLYDSAQMLFDAEPALDFVEICTQANAHRELVEMAAGRGVHVLCQKPAAETRAELVAMIEACDRAGVRLMIHENWRFRSWYRTLKRTLDAGSVGTPIRIRLAHRDFRALRPDGFREQPYLATAPELILLDMGCHLVDVARFLMGAVESVSATTGRFGESNVGEDVATLILRFESGALGLLDFSWCAAAFDARLEWALNETVLEGSQATIRLLADGALERITLAGESSRILPEPTWPGDVYLEGYLATQRHFIEGLRTGRPHETSGRDNLAVMEVVWAAYTSARTGRVVRIGSTRPVNGPRSLVEREDGR